jgi:sortase A
MPAGRSASNSPKAAPILAREEQPTAELTDADVIPDAAVLDPADILTASDRPTGEPPSLLAASSVAQPVLRTMGNVGLGGEIRIPSPHVALDQPYRTRTSPPERLVIPSIALDTKVVGIGTHPDRSGNLVWETAAFAVGHHEGTANPGQIGNVVLSGHISSPNEGAVFRRLPQLKVDDGFAIITAQQSFLYRVRDVRVVTPSAVDVLDHTDRAVATLITCVPDGIYSHRLVIRADAV